MTAPALSQQAGGRVPHDWTVSTLGHGELMCKVCFGTNRELAVIGDLSHCPARAALQQADARS
jgi:hypothetical protein